MTDVGLTMFIGTGAFSLWLIWAAVRATLATWDGNAVRLHEADCLDRVGRSGLAGIENDRSIHRFRASLTELTAIIATGILAARVIAHVAEGAQ